MATITGQSLVDAIQASTGVTLNPLLQATLAARLQQQLDTGTYSPLAAAVAIQGFSTEIKAVVDANGGSTAFSTHLTEVAAAIQKDTPVPEFVPEADQTFALTAGAAAVDEGATATFTLTTTGVAEGTAVAYTLSGIDAADLASGALTGNAVVGADGTATISVVLAADGATEGAETLTVTLDGKTVSATTTVNDTSVLGQTFMLTEALAQADTLPAGYKLSDATVALGELTVDGVAPAQAAAQAIVTGAANAADLTLAATYTLADTLDNLQAADAAVLANAASYSLSETAFSAAALEGQSVAALTGAQAIARADKLAELLSNPVVNGATNATSVTVANGAYTLADTLANLEAADPAVLAGAASYSLTETAFTAADVASDVAGLAAAQDAAEAAVLTNPVVAGAANAADVIVADGAYTLADTLDNLQAADAAVLANAASYSLTVTALTAADVTSDVAGLAAAQDAAEAAVLTNPVVAGAANAADVIVADGAYTLADTLANLQAADPAVLEGAASYSLTVTALTAADVASDVAGLAAAQDAAEAAVLTNPVVAGAANAADVIVADGAYTLADTLANLQAADAAVLEGAASYSLINAAGNLGILIPGQKDIVDNAANVADYNYVWFTFEAAAGNTNLEGAGQTYTVTAVDKDGKPVVPPAGTKVEFAITPGNATAGDQGTNTTNLNDFAEGSFNPKTVTFADNATTSTFVVEGVSDDLTELPESYTVTATIVGFETAPLAVTQDLLDGAGVGGGKTYMLTTGTDNFSPTATVAANKTTSGNDTFEATGKTFTALDYIDGGNGTDKIIIKDADGVMNTAVPSGITLKSVESMEIQTAGSLGVAAVTGQAAQLAVKAVDTYTIPNATLSSITVGYATPTNGDTLDVDADGAGLGGATTLTYVAASGKWADATLTEYNSLAEAVAAAVNAQSGAAAAFVGSDGLVYTKADLTAWTLTAGVGNGGTVTATKGTDDDALVGGGKFSVTYGGVTLQTAALDTTPTKAEAQTLIAGVINGIAGTTVATVAGDNLVITAPVAGVDLPSDIAITYWANGTNTTANPAGAIAAAVTPSTSVANQVAQDAVTAVTAAAYDVSGFADLADVAVTTSNGMALKAAATQNVTVSGSTGTITVEGGKDVTVTDATADKAITVGPTTKGAVGTITVTDTKVGTGAIAINGGTDVTVNLTGSTATGALAIGQGAADADKPTGAVKVTSVTAADVNANTTQHAVTITGGSTVEVTQTASSTKAGSNAEAWTAPTITQGAVTVTGANGTTSVTVNQTKSTAAQNAVKAVAAVTESASVKFGALKEGQSIIVGSATKDSTLDAGELKFTAAKDLTAEEVAQAFANLTNPDLQGGGKVANGTYSTNGNFTAWTSGAASGDTVVFSSTAAGPQTDLNAKTLPKVAETVTDPVVTPTNGVTAVPAATGVLGVITGAVTIDDNATAASAAITTVTLDGYGATGIGAANNLTKLETLNLSNSGGATAGATNAAVTANVGAALASLNLGLNNVQGAVTLTGAGLKTVNVTTSGANSATALSAAAAETLTIAGDKSVNLSTGTFTALKSITVSGSAGATFDGDEADTLTSVNTSATTGTVTATIEGARATYTGGAGVDIVTLVTDTVLTKAIDLGAGDDTLYFDAAVVSTTATLSGGEGVDTLKMKTDAAATLSGTAQTFYTGFERLTLADAGGTGNKAVNLANLGLVDYVTTTGSGGTLTLNNLANNGTVVLTTAPTTGYTINIKDAATGTADVLNVVLSSDGNLAAGVLTAADVETVSIRTVDTEAAPQTKNVDSLTLTADKATTVNLSGTADLTLTLTGSTAVTLVDASSMTGGLTLIANGATAGTEVRGGSGNDVLTASGENDVLKGNGGNDTFNLTDLTSAYGGADADIFNFAINSNLSKVSKVYEVGAGDVFNLVDVANTNTKVDKFYATGAQYNPDTTTDVAGKVNAALKQTSEGEATWFQHGTNTFIVIDGTGGVGGAPADQAETYVAGQDIVIQIVGLIDLGTGASFNNVSGTLEIL